MLVMQYRFIDYLNADQLIADDLVEINDEVVRVVNVVSLPEGYAVTIENDYLEKDIVEIKDTDTFKLFVYDE